MSDSPKRNGYKKKAKKGYAYFKRYVLCGVPTVWRWLLETPDRLTAISTFAIFLATAVMVGVGFAQWSALTSTDERIGEQVKILQRELRAWVAAIEVRPENGPIPWIPWRISIDYHNPGKTPLRI
jgi:hypothetical protein